MCHFKVSHENTYSSGLRNKILNSDHGHYLSFRLRDIIFSLIKPGNNLQINNTDDKSAYCLPTWGPYPLNITSLPHFFSFLAK